MEVGCSPNVKSTELKAEEIHLITNINHKMKLAVNRLCV
ncbi:hypothetical protein bthur0011_52530 [Bacillus thuringiensis serovar huazhongensis BGSC 4BD1]|nr:hypothetical protein bthur0011_52530 [Bacillus thuringiensis serovar huazhongensis BGSC 4BD1]KLA26263.1 hypothetical protein B4080_3770 [Bacillus cereus]